MSKIKDHYLAQNEQRVRIAVPEWDKFIFVGPMTFAQYLAIERVREGPEGGAGGNRALLEFCCKADNGDPAFDADELQELKLYGSPTLIARLARQVVDVQNTFAEGSEEKKD